VDSPIYLLSSGLPNFCQQHDRPVGPHFSDALNDISYGESARLPDEGLLTLGRLFEYALKKNYEEEFPEYYLDLEHLFYDGIHLTPDLYWSITHGAVIDFKYTHRSNKGEDVQIGCKAPLTHSIYSDNFWSNWQQLKGYTYALRQLGYPCKYSILALLYARGDYTYPVKVKYHMWQREFSDNECKQSWSMVKQHSLNHFCQICGEKLKGNMYGKCEC
jgi:hypothetical protein